MNNEPVAWMLNGKLHECDPSDWAKEEYPDDDVIPLYTHPAKYCPSEDNEAYEKGFIDGMQKQMQSSVDKFINGCVCGEPLTPNTVHRKDNPCYIKEELTNEEIEEIISECTMTKFVWNQPLQEFDAIGFARAILRKANEK